MKTTTELDPNDLTYNPREIWHCVGLKGNSNLSLCGIRCETKIEMPASQIPMENRCPTCEAIINQTSTYTS